MNLKGTYSGITKSGLAGRKLLAGDFNGDGKLDFLISPVQGNNSDIWEKHYSMGNGQFEISASREQYYENQLYNDFNFRYENAVTHNQGLGFCGFSKIMTKDNIRNREYIQTYAPYSYGILAEDESPVHKLSNFFTVAVLPDKIVKIILNNQTVQDKLKSITQTATYTIVL